VGHTDGRELVRSGGFKQDAVLAGSHIIQYSWWLSTNKREENRIEGKGKGR
jgi:hypothetical protein